MAQFQRGQIGLLAEGRWLLRNWLWHGLRRVFARLVELPLAGLLREPRFMLGLLPVILVFLISLKVPLLSPYVLVTYMPLVLLLMARGILQAGRYSTLFAALLLVVCVLSVQQNAQHRDNEINYQAFARQLQARMRPGDVILLRDAWWNTPLHYYFSPQQYDVRPPPDRSVEGGARAGLPDRVWIV